MAIKVRSGRKRSDALGRGSARRGRGSGGRAVQVLMAYIGVATVILLVNSVTGVGTGREHTRYSDQTECWDCHPDETVGWNGTRHAVDFSHYYIVEEGKEENLYIYKDGECTRCHVVGYGDVTAGGYDPAAPWNSTNNSMRLRVQCEDCHGPSSMHDGLGATEKEQATGTLRWPTASTCANTGAYGDLGGCHGPGGFDRYTPWRSEKMSGSNNEQGASNVSCYTCHFAEPFVMSLNGSHPGEDDQVQQPISCIACHDAHPRPDDVGNDFSLREPQDDICLACHLSPTPVELDDGTIVAGQGSMRTGLGGVGVNGTYIPPDNSTCYKCHMYETPDGYRTPRNSHEFKADPRSCADCHDGINAEAPAEDWPATRDEDPALWDAWVAWEADAINVSAIWQGVIDEIQTAANARLTDIGNRLGDVNITLRGYKAWPLRDENTSASASTLVDQAGWNLAFVLGDRSMGVHNTNYTYALLNASEDMADLAGEWLDTPLLLEPGFVPGDPEKGVMSEFMVTFADMAGKEPVSIQVEADGVLHNMTTMDNATSTYNGRTYALAIDLGEGQHRYIFRASNGIAAAESAMFSGNVTIPPNMAPVAVLDARSYSGLVGETISMSANGSHDPDGDLVALEWRFGDGSTAFGERVTHAYAAPGVYELRLTAVDDRGRSTNVTALVEMTATQDQDGGTGRGDGYVVPASISNWIGENRVAFILLIGLVFVSGLVAVEIMRTEKTRKKEKGKKKQKKNKKKRNIKKGKNIKRENKKRRMAT